MASQADEAQVSITGHHDQLDLAYNLQQALNTFNEGFDSHKVCAMFVGGVTLNLYRKMWFPRNDSRLETLNAELEQAIPSADQILKVGLYIAQRNRRRDLTFATRRIADAATHLRAVASPQHLLISLLYEREPLIQPNGVSLPIGTSRRQMLEDNWIKIAHPSSFLMETLRHVLLEEVIMDDRVVNEGISLNLHRQRRNAQIRLLRIFVELLSQTGLSSRSDAVDATRIDETLLRVLLTANLKRHPSNTQSVLLNKDQAKCSARWEAGIQGKQGDTRYIEQLTVRNAEAFVKIRSWIDNDPSVIDRPSCFASCHSLVPHYQIFDYTNGDFLP